MPKASRWCEWSDRLQPRGGTALGKVGRAVLCPPRPNIETVGICARAKQRPGRSISTISSIQQSLAENSLTADLRRNSLKDGPLRARIAATVWLGVGQVVAVVCAAHRLDSWEDK
jgi:hypothetical protein